MKLRFGVQAVVILGVCTFSVIAHAEDGYRGALKASLRKADFVRQSREVLKVARNFDVRPSERTFLALEQKLQKLQNQLSATYAMIAAVQGSLGDAAGTDHASFSANAITGAQRPTPIKVKPINPPPLAVK